MQVLNVAGAKARIARWIVAHFPPHDIYVEAFGGSGAVLIAKSPAKLEVFNDRDGGLVYFFQMLATRPEELIKRIDALFYSAFRDPTPTRDPLEIAARFFLHNNTRWPAANGNSFRRQTRPDRNGRTVALIFQQRKKDLEKVAERLKSVIFENRDALDIIERYDGANVLHYIDPPYYGPRRDHLYEYEMMNEASHRSLAVALHRARGSVVLSGYASSLYQELYGDWQIAVGHAHTNAKSLRQEYLWIKPSQNSQIRRAHQKAARPLREIVRETSRQISSEASKNPYNGERFRNTPKFKWDTALSEVFQKTEDGLSFSEIVRTLGISKKGLCIYLRRWESQGLIKQDSITKVWSAINGVMFGRAGPVTTSLKERAKINRIGMTSQKRLDYIARRQPELLKKIADGKLSIHAAYDHCYPSLSDAGLRKLRSAWKRATEAERERFRAEINNGVSMLRKGADVLDGSE
jgi:DNA adenine methylase